MKNMSFLEKSSKNIAFLDKLEEVKTVAQDKPEVDVTIVDCGEVKKWVKKQAKWMRHLNVHDFMKQSVL